VRCAACFEIAIRLSSCSWFTALRGRQLYSSTSCLGQTNGDCLFGRSGTVFALADVFYFFAHKLARLCGDRFAFTLILPCAFDCFFCRHNKSYRLCRRVWT
jgi:hypothetical protein